MYCQYPLPSLIGEIFCGVPKCKDDDVVPSDFSCLPTLIPHPEISSPRKSERVYLNFCGSLSLFGKYVLDEKRISHCSCNEGFCVFFQTSSIGAEIEVST